MLDSRRTSTGLSPPPRRSFPGSATVGVPKGVLCPEPGKCVAHHTDVVIKNGCPRASSLRSAPRLVVLVGNPTRRSRTLTVAELVADRVADATGATSVGTVDLADYADAMFRWPDDGLRVISEGVAAADI